MKTFRISDCGLRIWIVILALSSVASACPFCKDAAPVDGADIGGALPAGYNTSIYYMLGGLFVVIALVGRVLYRAIRASDH